MAGAEGFVLACRLGRCFCFAEVSTGDPHPSARGFGVNPRSQRLRAIFLRKQQHFNFTKIPKSQNDAILMLSKTIGKEGAKFTTQKPKKKTSKITK